MRNYPETIVIQKPKAQRKRARMSDAAELDIILAAIAPTRRKTAQAFIDYTENVLK
jgi:hypothetical protein